MADPSFDPRTLLDVLERHRVAYVVIGGLARVIQGTDEVTGDVDICPSTRPENLRRLGESLAEMEIGDATWSALLGADPQLTSIAEVETRHGHLTLVPEPVGTRGYDDLRRAASREALGGGLRASIADPGDLVRSLDGLNRAGDQTRVEALRYVVELEQSFGLER